MALTNAASARGLRALSLGKSHPRADNQRMALHDPHYWQGIYDAEARPGWDMDGPTPLLAELLELAESLGLAVGPRILAGFGGFGRVGM